MSLWRGLMFLFKQKTAYDMRISDWSSDVCSSDLSSWRAVRGTRAPPRTARQDAGGRRAGLYRRARSGANGARGGRAEFRRARNRAHQPALRDDHRTDQRPPRTQPRDAGRAREREPGDPARGDPADRSDVRRYAAVARRADRKSTRLNSRT